MGHTTQIFAVDLTRLRGFFGSRDETQLAELYAANVEELDSLNDRFGDQIDSDDEEWPLAEDALAEICAGQCSSANAAPLYGYVLEIVCRSLGNRIATLGPLKMHPYRSELLSARVPIPIPTSEDFPTISFLEHAQVETELQIVRVADRPDDECLSEDIDDYQSALEQALAENNAIVAFYY